MSVKKEVEVNSYKNHSPWIHQLEEIRKPKDILEKDIKTDISIIGGGISGISTAYFLLKNTSKKVVLIEGNKIAHGATGHNAGQVVSYFEKPFFEIAKEYGLDMAAKGQREVLLGWGLIEEIYKECNIKASFSKFIGYAACSTYEQVLSHLKNKYLRKKAGLEIDKIIVSNNAPFLNKIPKKFKSLYEIYSQKEILEILQTQNKEYFAALASNKGCLNSALFCEEVISYLLYKYKNRFNVFEFTKVDIIELYEDKVILKVKDSKIINSEKVVLCTNGFENIDIINWYGKDINYEFHDLIYGVVGYMAAYVEKKALNPNALSYFPKSYKEKEDSYFYLTRRRFNKNSLVSIGGPEVKLDNKREYNRDRPYFEKRQEEINIFVKKNYKYFPKNIKYSYHWHGLMGYTKNGLRVIGPHPNNSRILYNLGCNGVGILPSIYGGYKISNFINDIKMPKSIFDVK